MGYYCLVSYWAGGNMGLDGIPELFRWIMIPTTYVIAFEICLIRRIALKLTGVDERTRKSTTHNNIKQKNILKATS
jgi:hypothetical protein